MCCPPRFQWSRLFKWTEELTSLAQQLGDESLLLEAQHCRSGDEVFGGDVLRLLETTEDCIRRYDAKRHAHLAHAFGGHDPGVCALVTHARGLSLRGLPDQARRAVERALVLLPRQRLKLARGTEDKGARHVHTTLGPTRRQ